MSPTDILLMRVNQAQLYPPFLEKVRAMLSEGIAMGVQYWAISGHRSAAEQESLFAIGRTRPGARVTKAGAFQSMHNYGLAIDFCRDASISKGGLQPDWRKDSYKELGELAEKHGLRWGGLFKGSFDGPHVEYKQVVHRKDGVLDVAKLRDLYSHVGGLDGVWEYLNGALSLSKGGEL